MDYSYVIWIPLIPLISFLITGLFGKRMPDMVSGMIATAGMGIACVLSLMTAANYFFSDAETLEAVIAFNYKWLGMTENLHIDLGGLIDPISVMMLVVITVVSLMVHFYSLGYMKGDPAFAKFYAFLSLFSFSMLGLVLAPNIFQMYIFWELVGVSSYLLIGYYYTKPSAVAASKKAFIVTRFADLGFLIGILVLSFDADTFEFSGIINHIVSTAGAEVGAEAWAFMGMSSMTWGLLLVFIGGAGKSAMFPLHIWLPDAMEGPTPVSALIHAATMVVAGVYMVARLFPAFDAVAPEALTVVAWVGAFSSLFAAIIACTQTDIKRVLAYSTMSQIGYMMCALGVASQIELPGNDQPIALGFTASMFHLFTHAMFKALLFLGAGAVIHAVHSNEMKDMGQLRKYMPITHITFLIACLAIAGIPPFAGFFSKDEILVAAFENNMILFVIEYAVAGITAFYMFRLYFNIFWGQDKTYEHAPHEAPFTMTLPLMILAAGSIGAGFLPFSKMVTATGEAFVTHMHWNVAAPSIAIAVLGILVAFFMYKKKTETPEKIAKATGPLYTGSYNKFYIDEFYNFVTKKIIFQNISTPIAWFDRNVVDALMDFTATITNWVSAQIKGFQSGQLQQYAFVFVSSAIVLGIIFIYLLINAPNF